jgi:hypothetical protein
VSTAANRQLDTARQRRFARIATGCWSSPLATTSSKASWPWLPVWLADRSALTGFGFDSAIEVVGAIVLWRPRAELRHGTVDERQERRAMLAITFFALAAYIVAAGIRDLLTAARPETSLIGIGLTALSAVFVIAYFAIREGPPSVVRDDA